jgi:hypothetical protein
MTLSLAVAATALLIAPITLHRALFRPRSRAALVAGAHTLEMSGLGLLGLAIVALTTLIFQAVLGRYAGLEAVVCALALVGGSGACCRGYGVAAAS